MPHPQTKPLPIHKGLVATTFIQVAVFAMPSDPYEFLRPSELVKNFSENFIRNEIGKSLGRKRQEQEAFRRFCLEKAAMCRKEATQEEAEHVFLELLDIIGQFPFFEDEKTFLKEVYAALGGWPLAFHEYYGCETVMKYLREPVCENI